MYKIRQVTDFLDLSIIKGEWNRLLKQTSNPSFFLCYEWIYCWWQTFSHEDDRLTVVIAQKDGDCVAIAPLMIRRRRQNGFALNLLMFIGVPNADRCDFIIKDGENAVFPHLWNYIDKKVKGWDQFHLNEVPENSAFGNWLQQNCKRVYVEQASDCPFVSLSHWKDWEEFYKSLSKKTRLELNRKNNALKKEGKSNYVHITAPLPNEPAIRIARNLEQESFKAQRLDIRSLAITGNEGWLFQQRLLKHQGDYKVLLTYLERKGRIIAYLYGYVYENRYYAYNTAFLPAEKKLFPGKLIINEAMHYCMNSHIEVFDLLRGATHLKKRWTKKSFHQINVFYLRNTLINQIYAWLVFSIRPLIKNIFLIICG